MISPVKILLKGADTLSNSELLAILINNGTRGQSAIDVAKSLYRRLIMTYRN